MMNIRRKLDDSLSVTSSLGHIVSPLLYPSNSIKCVTEDNGHVFTRDVLTLLGNLDLEHPVGQYVHNVCRGFVEQYRTGGDQLLFFISSWTKAAQLLCDMGISSALVVHLLETVVEGCIGHTETLQITVRDVLDKYTASKTGEEGQEVDNKETSKYGPQDVVSNKNREASEGVVDIPQIKERQPDGLTTCSLDDTGNHKSHSKDFEEVSSGLKETDHEWISEPVRRKHLKESSTNMSCQLKPVNDFLGRSDNYHSGQHADISHESAEESILPTSHSQELTDEITSHIQDYTNSKSNLGQKERKSKTEEGPEEFIDGIKIVQLKMNNAEGMSDKEIEEDLSWFFTSEGSKTLNTDQTNYGEIIGDEPLENADYIAAISPKQNDLRENNEKSDSTVVTPEQTVDSTDKEDKSHRCLPDKANGDTGCFNNVEGSNMEDVDGYDGLKNELVALKSYIEMDIKRIKQGQKKLKKVSYSTKGSSDVHFDACFEDLDDEFDPCFDDSFPVKGSEMSSSNSQFGTKSSSDDFRTVQFIFENGSEQSNNTFDKVTHDKDLCKQDQTVSQNDSLCDKSNIQSRKHSSTDNNIEDFEIDGDSEMQSDEDFDNCFDNIGKFDLNTSKLVGCNKQINSGKVYSNSKPTDTAKLHKDFAKTDKGPSKPSCKGKLQDIDTLLKRVGKETKSTNYSASSVKISSRHMTGMRNECSFRTSSESTNIKEANNVGSSNSVSKATNKTQLQDIDTLLKGLGKETKRLSYSAKSLQIASRHLTSEGTENNVRSLSAASCTTPEVAVFEESEDTNGDNIGSKDKAKHNEDISAEMLTESVTAATAQDRADSKSSEKAHHTLGTIGMNKIDKLLKGIKSVDSKTKSDKPKFKSNVFVRSRHFASDMVTEEHQTNTVRNDIAVTKEEGSSHSSREEASNAGIQIRFDGVGKKKIVDLVTDLNYGTDVGLVSVVAEAVVKQSQDNHLRLLPQYVQTYTITGGQRKPQLVDGLLLKTPHDQTEAVHKLTGRSCKLLIVNADITSSYKHKGYKPMKTTKVFTAETFSSHVTQRDQWALGVTDLLKTLSIDIVLARGSISEDFKLLCDDLGLVAMEFVPYRQLSIISETARITMVTYITLATEENVCQNVQISPWIPGSGDDTKKCVSRSCQHASIIRITGNNPQTVVLQNHSQPLVSLEEESMRDCLHRTGSTLQSGLMLPGAGHTETHCARYCLNMAEKRLKEPQWKGSFEESQYLATTYEVLARTFQEYGQQVQHHCALVCDKPSDCVYDDCTSKVEAWRTAVNTVCILMSSDFYIMTGLRDEQRVSNEFVIL